MALSNTVKPPPKTAQTHSTLPTMTQSSLLKPTPTHLSLKLGCNTSGQTVLRRRYTRYPLHISKAFRLEDDGTEASLQRAYLYQANSSAGLLAGDDLDVFLHLDEGSAVCLLDQSATKVHEMPGVRTQASVKRTIEVGDRAILEYLAEPTILYAKSALTQTTAITLHPQASLAWSEIVMPGRLAKGEVYQFRHYRSAVQIKSPDGKLLVSETTALEAEENSPLGRRLVAAKTPVTGTLLLLLPSAVATSHQLAQLSAKIHQLSDTEDSNCNLSVVSSTLTCGRGVRVSAIASTTSQIQACFYAAANSVRYLLNQAPLPYSVYKSDLSGSPHLVKTK